MDNNFKQIEFLDSFAHLLTNEKMVNDILDRLDRHCIVPGKSFEKWFKKIENEDVQQLAKKKSHLVSLSYPKSTFAFLYLTKYNGVRFAFYITHDVRIIAVKYRFNQALYDRETLLEGYLIKGDNNHYYVVTDLILYEGKVSVVGIKDRVKLLNNIIDNRLTIDPVLDVAELVVNDFVELSNMKSFLMEFEPPYRSAATGIIFTPTSHDNKHLFIGFNNLHEIKVPHYKAQVLPVKINDKLDTNKKICFNLERGHKPDIYNLYLMDGTKRRFFDIASIPDKQTSQLIADALSGRHNINIVCKYDPTFHRWKPFMKSSRNAPDQLRSVKEK
jgi:hypothetical protein